jgi:hypothetical protein
MVKALARAFRWRKMLDEVALAMLEDLAPDPRREACLPTGFPLDWVGQNSHFDGGRSRAA